MRDRVLAWLADNVPDARLQHILRVEQMSAELARHHDIDVEKASQAGLLHDLAKNFQLQHLLQMAQAEGLELDPVDEANPHLLHAQVGAIVARDQFGVQDEEILQAIQNHTLGRPGMSLLSCIVFLSDSLEPGRGYTLELEALRQVSRQNIYRAVWQTCDYSLKYLMETHRLIHPRAILTRNWAMAMASHQRQPADNHQNYIPA
jgi:predicted HD superfamily hydrolase involved in NAD metabolism